MKRPRDSQRSRLYAAEWEMFGWPKMEFKSMDNLKDYFWKVLNNRHVQNKYPVARSMVAGNIETKIANGAGLRETMIIWDGDRVWVSFPRRARTKWAVIHEIAHLVAPQDAAEHGREFARTYLHLVKLFYGKPAEDKFKAAMKKHQCKYSRSHSRWTNPPSQEEKTVMLDRLLVGRKKWLITNGTFSTHSGSTTESVSHSQEKRT